MQDMQNTLPIGTIIRGRYVVQALLGKSESGATYLVRDEHVKQTVFNLFVLKEVMNLSKQEQHRFTFELALFKRLDHPVLPRVYDVFSDEMHGRAYMLMDYIEGPNLDVVLLQQPKKRFSMPQVMVLMTPIMDAVMYLHSQRPPIIHQDIKPANIIMPNASEETVLVDLCIAKEYGTETITTDVRHGTPGYIAPEQYSGEATTATDIYALGATFYRLLTGTVPADALVRLTQLDNKGPDPLVPGNRITPTIPMTIARAIHRAMFIRSTNHFSTVEQFRQALNANPKVQQTSLLEVTAKDYKALNAKPVVQQASAPIVVRKTSPEPPVVPEQAVVRPAAASIPKRPHVPRFRKLGTVWSAVRKQVIAGPATRVPKQLSPPRSRKVSVPLLPILLVLLIGISAGTVLWSYVVGFQGLGFAIPTTALTHTATPHSSSRPTVAATPTLVTSLPIPTSTFSVNAGRSYNGTIYSIAANVTTKMSLTGFQQSQGNISGYFTGLHMSGSLRGSIDASKHVQFTVTDYSGHATLSFEGSIVSDGNIVGNYCILDQKGQCTGEYGLWSVAPAA